MLDFQEKWLDWEPLTIEYFTKKSGSCYDASHVFLNREDFDFFKHYGIPRGNGQVVIPDERGGVMILSAFDFAWMLKLNRFVESRDTLIQIRYRIIRGEDTSLGLQAYYAEHYDNKNNFDGWDGIKINVNNEGEYQIVSDHYIRKEQKEIVPWTESKNINRGNGINELQALILDEYIFYWINGVALDAVEYRGTDGNWAITLYDDDAYEVQSFAIYQAELDLDDMLELEDNLKGCYERDDSKHAHNRYICKALKHADISHSKWLLLAEENYAQWSVDTDFNIKYAEALCANNRDDIASEVVEETLKQINEETDQPIPFFIALGSNIAVYFFWQWAAIVASGGLSLSFFLYNYLLRGEKEHKTIISMGWMALSLTMLFLNPTLIRVIPYCIGLIIGLFVVIDQIKRPREQGKRIRNLNIKSKGEKKRENKSEPPSGESDSSLDQIIELNLESKNHRKNPPSGSTP